MSDKNIPISGGCLCGDVMYRTTGASVLVEFCHCRSCRHAAGAPLMAWAAFLRREFVFTAGNPIGYESSPGVVRTFCGRCGTSLTLTDERFPGEIYISVGSFDDAEKLPPEFHIWRSHRISWLETSDRIPRYVQFKADGIEEQTLGQA